MARTKHNAVADMIDLDLRLAPPADDGETVKKTYSLQAALRASHCEFYCDQQDIHFRAAVKRLVIRVELAGLEVAPGPRPHDPIKAASEVLQVKTTNELKSEGKLSGGASLKLDAVAAPAAALDAGASANRSWLQTRTSENVSEITTRCVTARPGDRWEVYDQTKTYLDATYLTEKDPLCDVTEKDRTNRRYASATIEVHQRDLHLEVVPPGSLIKRVVSKGNLATKKRLAAIVVAKDISAKIGSSSYSGKIVLSYAEDNDE